nr:hypothetical protein [Streptomyces sp. CB04723]
MPEGVYGARSVAGLPLPLGLITSGSEGVGVIMAQMTGASFDKVLEVIAGSRYLAGLSKTPPDPKKHVVCIAVKESLFGALVQRHGAGS